MGILNENSMMNGNTLIEDNQGNHIQSQELFSMSTKSSLGEDVEFQHDEQLADETAKFVPTAHYNITDESRKPQNGDKNVDHVDEPVQVTITSAQPGASKSFLVFFLVFGISVLFLMLVYTRFPRLEKSEKSQLKLPRSIDDAKILGGILSRYRDKYYFEVLSAVCAIYIFLQTFAIPGSIFLSIMSGFLFSFPVAISLICFCSATGASFCYVLSFFIGRRVIYKYFPQRAANWAETVDKHRDNLLSYIIFLRITPFLPNWFINITSPVINVPIVPFWVGTFIGVAPPSFLAVQAGTTLQQMTSSSNAVSWTSFLVLIGLGFVVLIPAILRNKIKSKFE